LERAAEIAGPGAPAEIIKEIAEHVSPITLFDGLAVTAIDGLVG
jgi:hypothetical protein